jgi:anti-sigma factor RsiW
MPNTNERPVCHRAEDLVTYLYGEASELDARDFAGHLQQCDACRSEFGVFRQVHDSILLWRNEALGSAFSAAPALVESTVDSTQFVGHERKLTALAALREFFSVSPLWLRAATGFAALLLCLLGVLVISRSWNKPVQRANKTEESRYSKEQFDQAVKKQVDEKLAQLNVPQTAPKVDVPTPGKSKDNETQVAVNRVPRRTQRARGLNRQEREQLAADLRLIPGRGDDELPFVFSDEPR